MGPLPTISVHPPPSSSNHDRLMAPRTADLPSRTKQFTFPDVSTSSGADSDSAQSSNSNGSVPFHMNHKLNRHAWNMWTIRNGSAWKDVTIQWSDIRVNKVIGRGRFGDVS